LSFKTIQLKKTYSSDLDNLLYDFYIPILKESTEYNRLTGFFSSSSLVAAAKGILGFVKNNGTMKLITSPKLNQNDVNAILDAHEHPEKYIEMKLLDELESSNFSNDFVRDHILALGWMVANKRLEIKITIPHNDKGIPLTYEEIQESGIFHQKVGTLRDSEGNIITFSGSINETAAGWLENIEEFKVFRSWEPLEEDYIKADILKFDRFWEGKSQRVMTIDIPHAVKNKLIEIAPDNINQINLKKWYKDLGKKKKITLFQHQKDAINAWIENNMMGIFEMATGTGKTFAALGCLKTLENQKKLVTVIACPYSHLIQQWIREINKFDIYPDCLLEADSSNSRWRNALADLLIDVSIGNKDKIIVLTTHATFSSKDFIKIIQNNKGNINLLLIADEVHGLGAEVRGNGLLEEYNFRLGLSATPKRWFDTLGTETIYNYFGDVVYKFPLSKAINTINPTTGETYLTPYRYIPKFVSLTSEELKDYVDKTKTIAARYGTIKDGNEKNNLLEAIIFQRANTIKNATEKYGELENILNEIGQSIKYTIIYCTPQQIDKVMDIVKEKGIIAHRFTMREGTKSQKKFENLSERDYILQKFSEKKYKILVAMKCLDEGVDIPPARTTILMASSGNPREYIQRLGRVVRRAPVKKEATIYDVVVVPSFNALPMEMKKIERKIFEKELKRYEKIAKIAINNAEALTLIYSIETS